MKALITLLHQYICAMSEDAIIFAEKVEILSRENAKLKSEIDFLKRHIFGKKSERFISAAPGQLSFESFGVELPDPIESAPDEIRESSKEKQKPVRKPLDESKFEVIVEEIHPDVNLEVMKFIGVEESTHQVLVDAKIVIKKIRRFRYQNTTTGEIIIADMPYRPFAKSSVSASIVAEVVVQKYVDAKPINRQQQAFERLGVVFSHSSLYDMPVAGHELIAPLFTAFSKDVMSAGYLQVDESPIKVLSSEKKGATHRGFYYVALDPVQKRALYTYRPHKNNKVTRELLEGFQGVMQTDGYDGYDQFVKCHPEVCHLYCMAHARRHFENALDNHRELASYAVSEIQKLYLIERQIREQNLEGERIVQFRKQHAVPLLNSLHQWLQNKRDSVNPSSPIGKAIEYSLKRWQGLMEYCNHADAHIDNNAVERSIRPMVIGKKNYLFAGSHEGAERAAAYYSFFITCRLNGVNPKQWIEDVFNKIEHTKPSQYHTLFPQNWRK
jgi:hypothetical protein